MSEMIFKAVTVLAIAASCYAIPIEDASKSEASPIVAAASQNSPSEPELIAPPTEDKSPIDAIPIEEVSKSEASPIVAVSSQNSPSKPELIDSPMEYKSPIEQPAFIAVPSDSKDKGAKSEESDLQTDNTLWWKTYYRYPVASNYYHNYKYVPRSYSNTYYTPGVYPYWRSYW